MLESDKNDLIDADCSARKAALDIQKSYIVQAPAGSGKTELLMRRYLQLLAHVEKAPEEILAITFTKKAAHEMQERILQALQDASLAAPDNAYEKQRWQLAHNVMKRDSALHWQLLKNPHRLQIKTIDAFCAQIVGMMPILSRFGGPTAVTEKPLALYQEAVKALFEETDEDSPWQEALDYLILHCDNQYEKIHDLLIELLQKRDQWLPYILAGTDRDLLKKHLENSLNQLLEETFLELTHLCPANIRFELENILEQASCHCFDETSSIAQYAKSQDIFSFWRACSQLLLTTEGNWRKTLTKAQGFLAPSDAKNEAEKISRQESKAALLELISALEGEEAFQTMLSNIQFFPKKPVYSTEQWDMLCALITVLPILCAQLQLIFKKHQTVDFTEVSLQALAALGSEATPTDLSLYLDYQIQHLLVDEFQDTSITQYKLIEKLVSTWEVGSSKTLFLVGDPMQSIYRFRQAEVGLFLSAQTRGIGGIFLESLQLRENFRSEKIIVDWLNDQFENIFPAVSNVEMGAVHYSTAVSQKLNQAKTSIRGSYHSNPEEEADYLIRYIQNQRAYFPDARIALLVRSRSHLAALLPALQQASIDYHAIEMDNLIDDPNIQDLLNLTKALHHFADKIAWLSLLRSPWIGLTLQDLTILSTQYDCLYEGLSSQNLLEKLSPDGAMRLKSSFPILETAVNLFGHIALYDCLHLTWLQLTLTKNLSPQVNAFFNCLAEHETGGKIADFEVFEHALEKLHLPTQCNTGAIEIMTIHKSKGLEFDIVIIPSCDKTPRPSSQSLLLFEERAKLDNATDLLLAPIHAKATGSDPIYQLLSQRQKIRYQHELKRLLYVALTRAKSHIHLSSCIDLEKLNRANQTGTPPFSSTTFMGILWQTCKNDFSWQEPRIKKTFDFLEPCDEKTTENIPTLKRLSLESIQLRKHRLVQIPQIWQPEISNAHLTPQDYHWQPDPHSAIGTLCHEILANLSSQNLNLWTNEKIESLLPAWAFRLQSLGLLNSHLKEGLDLVKRAISNTLHSEIGRWILKHRSQAYSEYALHMVENETSQSYRIDRYFVEDGIAWIVDYKITKPAAEIPLNLFFNDAKAQYQRQMEI
jgi:ATP-dependent helicase/nuclease subunit A